MKNSWLLRAAILSGLAAGTAIAQESPTKASGSEALEEVIITGTRLSTSGFTTPTPVTVLGPELLEQRAPVDLNEVIRELPSVRVSSGATNTGSGQSSAAGQSYVDLRGLTPVRTLVLVDGRRTAAAGSTGVFDVNLLPTSLLSRIEIVTGGASAAYGSDAVAGVANFILKDQLDGFSGNFIGSAADHGGAGIMSGSLAFGSSVGARGRMLIGVDASNNDGLESWYDREYGRKEPGLISYGTAGTATRVGRPAQQWVNGFELANNTPGGIVTAGPLRGTAFDAAGNPYTFQYGTVIGSNMFGTTANFGDNPNSYFDVSTPYRRRVGLAQFSYDITDDMRLLLQAAGGRTTGETQQNISNTSTTVTSSNPFIPAATRAAMAAAGATTITVGRTNTDLGSFKGEQVNDNVRLLADLSGRIFGSWDWDVYYQHSKSSLDGTFTGFRTADINAAFGAVTVGGVAQCATVAGASAGCVPFNIFGVGKASADAYAYLNQYTQGFVLDMKQDVAEVTVRGEPLSTWAGPLAVAVGVDYRKDQQDSTLARDSARFPQGGFAAGNYVGYESERDVKEAFGEVNVPLLRGAVAAKALDLNGAARYTSYSDSGSYNTWKAGLTWDISDEYRLRGTRSRDIRAPSLFEQYGTSSQFTVQVQNPATGTTDSPSFQKGISLSLKAETADTTTVGFVFQPSWLSGLRLSVDYFDIQIDGAVVAPASNILIDGCQRLQIAVYCNQLTFNSAGRITAIVTQTLNLNELQTRGFDVEAAYRLPMRVLGGDVSLRALGTHVDHFTTTDPTTNSTTEEAGTVRAPHWKGTFNLTYANGSFSTTAELLGFTPIKYSTTAFGPDDARYYQTVTSASCPGGTAAAPTQCANYLVASNSISKNLFPSFAYLNWSAQFNLPIDRLKQLQLFVGVNDVFDRQPPDYAAVAFANFGIYDLVGRTYKAGARFAF